MLYICTKFCQSISQGFRVTGLNSRVDVRVVTEICKVVVVVVALLFYVHGKHLRSCRDGQLT